jgi:hypothetical protein
VQEREKEKKSKERRVRQSRQAIGINRVTCYGGRDAPIRPERISARGTRHARALLKTRDSLGCRIRGAVIRVYRDTEIR